MTQHDLNMALHGTDIPELLYQPAFQKNTAPDQTIELYAVLLVPHQSVKQAAIFGSGNITPGYLFKNKHHSDIYRSKFWKGRGQNILRVNTGSKIQITRMH